MSRFLKAIMENNSFTIKLTAYFENNNPRGVTDLVEIDAKIDTGCYDSHISYNSMFIPLDKDEELNEKIKWLKQRKHTFSIGVHTKNICKSQEISDLINNPNVVIQNRFYNINIGGIDIGNRYLRVSYDTDGKALLGMGIFKDWDIHIGKNKQGKTLLIGCPNNMINQEYYLELEKEFGISQNLNAAIINNINIHKN